MESGMSETPALELLEVSVDSPQSVPDAAPARQHRPLVLTIGLVAALLAGVGFLTLRPDAGAAPALATPLPSPQARAAAPPAGIEGFAELFVTSYLTGEGGMPLRHFYAAAPVEPDSTATRFVRHIAALSIAPLASGGWQVHLAADVLAHDGVGYQPHGVQHFAVGVVATATGLAATGLPVQIPAPVPAPIPSGQGMAPIEDAGLVALVEGFLGAYLAGDGDLRAFVDTAAGISAVTPAPFHRVAIDELHGTALDERRIWLRSLATAEDRYGSMVVEHHLVVSGVDGTWSIERLETGPPPLPSD